MEPNFSPNDFSKWIRQQSEFENLDKPKKRHRDIIGTMVESKIRTKRLQDVISTLAHFKTRSEYTPDSSLYELAMDFKENGGTIKEVNGIDFLIEVSCGEFFIPRYYVRSI
ncbi:MAG: hypothetical protein ACW99G_00560 [Candidatus Thorarchaeota archaeon]|jgi:hypothetical protein